MPLQLTNLRERGAAPTFVDDHSHWQLEGPRGSPRLGDRVAKASLSVRIADLKTRTPCRPHCARHARSQTRGNCPP